MKKTGNELVTVLGGREIHPINVRVGGFYKVPTKRDLGPLAEKLKWARDTALEMVRWTAALPFPEFARDYEFVALRHPDEYPFNEGRLVSNKGLDISIRDYEQHFVEEHVPRSNALHSVLKERGAYFVGPNARYSLNFDRLSPLARRTAGDAGLGTACRNPFQSIVVRAVELLYACDEALRIIEQHGEGAALMDAWRGFETVILIDAVQSGGPPAIIHRLDARVRPVPTQFFHCSSHAFGVAEAIAMARALDRLPPRLVVFGIEGKNFAVGGPLSAELSAAVARVAATIREEIQAWQPSERLPAAEVAST